MLRDNKLPFEIHTLVITPLPKERNAFISMFSSEPTHHYFPDVSLKCDLFQIGKHGIAITTLSEMGNVAANSATSRACSKLKPQNVLIVGIGAGVQEIARLGDILIPSSVFYYESGKQIGESIERRPQHQHVDNFLFSCAQTYDRSGWRKHIKSERLGGQNDEKSPFPIVHSDGPLGSGEKVIKSKKVMEELKRIQPKFIGADMESFGVADALSHFNPKPRLLVIRGVTDYGTEPKNDDWHVYAAEAAAAFAFDFIEHILSNTDIEDITSLRQEFSEHQIIIIRHQSLDHLPRKYITQSLPENLQNADQNVIVIDQTSSYLNGQLIDPWSAVLQQIELKNKVYVARKNMPDCSVFYFGLTHIPLAFFAGYQLEKCPINFYERGRDGDSWWGMDNTTNYPLLNLNTPPLMKSSDVGPVVIRIAISYAVKPEECHYLVPDAIADIDFSIPFPRRDSITSTPQLNSYSQKFRTILDDIRNLLPNTTSLHIFYSGPVSLAVKLGQQISPRTDPPVVVYNYFKPHPYRYDWAFKFNAGEMSAESVSMAKGEENDVRLT